MSKTDEIRWHDLVNELCYRLNTRAGKWSNSTDRESIRYTREDCLLDEKITDALRCADERMRDNNERLRAIEKAAADVCWWDWSDNDDDAVAAVEALRSGLGPMHVKAPPGRRDHEQNVRKNNG